MSRTSAGLGAVAAFTLVVPMVATTASAVPASTTGPPVQPPQLPVQPPQYLQEPDTPEPYLVAGAIVAASPADDLFDLYGFEEDEADGTLTRTEEPVVGNGEAEEVGQVDPAFSPDGSQLVFSVQVPSGDPDTPPAWLLMVGDVADAADGPGVSNVRQLDYPTVSGAADYQPAWSPDGQRIAFVREYPGDGPRAQDGPQVQILDLDNPEELTEISLPEDPAGMDEDYRWTMAPTWAPDSSGLLVVGSIGQSTGEEGPVDAFAPVDPDANGTGSLWYYGLEGGVHHLSVVEAGCTDDCGFPVDAGAVAWSPTDARTVAYTDPLASGVFFLTLPSALPTTDDGADLTLTAAGTSGAETSFMPADLVWDPGGEAVYGASGESESAQVQRTTPEGEVSTVFQGEELDTLQGIAYQPYSDLSISLEAPGSVQVSTQITMTAEVTNAGPSPSRPGQVQVDVDYDTAPASVPAGCDLAGSTLHCTADVDGLAAGESAQVALRVPASDHPEVLTITGVALSDSPSRATNTGSWTSTSTLVLDDPSPITDARSERISFSMDRLRTGAPDNPWSLDLVQSVASEAGDPAATDYTVLASSLLQHVDSIEGDGEDLGPLLATEDNIDYSADGSRAVFTRTAGAQYSYTDDQRLVLADVVGTQQQDLGTPGELIDLTEVTDSPGALPSDPEGPDRVSDTEPVFSPEGTQIAFVRTLAQSDFDYPGQLMLLAADGTTMTSPFDPDWLAETGTELTISSPTWSPDADAIIFSAQGDGEDMPTLWYLPLSTGIPHQLTLPDDGSLCWPGFGGDLCEGTMQGWQPAWAPTGGQVAFTYYTSGGTGIGVLTVDHATARAALSADWTTPVPIADLTAVEALTIEDPDAPPVDSPAWSPDGERVAVAQGGSDYPNQIVAAGLTAAEATTLFAVPAVGTQLAHPEFEPVSDLAVQVGRPSGTLTTGRATDVRVQVTNTGPSPARDAIVTISLPRGARSGTLPATCSADGRTLTCTLTGPITVGTSTELAIPVTFTAAGEHEITATVATNSIDTVTSNDTANRTLTASPRPGGSTGPAGTPTTPGRPAAGPDLQVQVSTSTDRAWLGGTGLPATVTVTNAGTAPAPGAQLSLTLPPDVLVLDAGTCPVTGVCDLGALASGGQVSVDLLLQPTAVGQVQLTASASTTATDPLPGNNSATAVFEAVQAQLRLLPAVAEPGEVTLLYGVDLPPDAQIELRWSEGITTVQWPVSAKEDGTLRTSVLIVDGDELGQRTLQVTSVAGTAFGLESPPTLLVVPHSMEPPDFLGRS